MKTRQVHIDLIRPGDTVIHDGKQRTVTQTIIGGDSFIGRTLWGDSYRLGTQPVTVVDLRS